MSNFRKARNIGFVIVFSTFILVMIFMGLPHNEKEKADLIRKTYNEMANGIDSIKIYDRDPRTLIATISDTEITKKFAQVIAQESTSIKNMEFGHYKSFNMEIFTSSGSVIYLYIRFHPLKTHGCQILISRELAEGQKTPLLDIRNDSAGRIIAECIDMKLR